MRVKIDLLGAKLHVEAGAPPPTTMETDPGETVTVRWEDEPRSLWPLTHCWHTATLSPEHLVPLALPHGFSPYVKSVSTVDVVLYGGGEREWVRKSVRKKICREKEEEGEGEGCGWEWEGGEGGEGGGERKEGLGVCGGG